MKVEKRGDKYFVILSNGEVEISKESFDLKAKAANDFTNDFTNNFMEYLEVGKEFLEGSNFSLGESIDMKIDSLNVIVGTHKKHGQILLMNKALRLTNQLLQF